MLFGASRTLLHRVFPVQCIPRSIKTTLHRIFSFAISSVVSRTTLHRVLTCARLFQEYCDNIAEDFFLCNVVQIRLRQHCKENYLCNAGPEHTDIVLKENNLHNIVLNLPGPTLRKTITCTIVTIVTIMTTPDNSAQENYLPMLAQSAKTCFRGKTGYSFKCIVACFLNWYNIIEQSWLFLFNVCSFHSMFAWEFIYIFWDSNEQGSTLTETV